MPGGSQGSSLILQPRPNVRRPVPSGWPPGSMSSTSGFATRSAAELPVWKERVMPTSTGWPHAWSMRRLQESPACCAPSRLSSPASAGRAGYSNNWAPCTCSFRRIDGLRSCLPILRRPCAPAIGYPIGKSEVLALPGIVDHWFAVGMVDTAEYRLDTRRVWLYGAASGRWAVIMSFAPPGGPLDDTVLAGNLLHARLHFYPGSGQFRALVGEQTSATAGATMPPAESFADVRARFAQLVAADPWAARMPAVINAAPVPSPGPWRLRAASGECCKIIDLPEEPWPLLARSGGRADRGLRRVDSPRFPAAEPARDGRDRTIQHRRCGTGGLTTCRCGRTS